MDRRLSSLHRPAAGASQAAMFFRTPLVPSKKKQEKGPISVLDIHKLSRTTVLDILSLNPGLEVESFQVLGLYPSYWPKNKLMPSNFLQAYPCTFSVQLSPPELKLI